MRGGRETVDKCKRRVCGVEAGAVGARSRARVRTPGWRGGFLGADGWRARWAQRCAVIGAPDWAVPGSLQRNGTTCMDVGAVCGWRRCDKCV